MPLVERREFDRHSSHVGASPVPFCQILAQCADLFDVLLDEIVATTAQRVDTM
jgi:hypothetical protein